MKAKLKKNKLTIKFENADEMRVLWHRLNIPIDRVMFHSTDHHPIDATDPEIAGIDWNAWELLDDRLHELEDKG